MPEVQSPPRLVSDAARMRDRHLSVVRAGGLQRPRGADPARPLLGLALYPLGLFIAPELGMVVVGGLGEVQRRWQAGSVVPSWGLVA